MSDGPKIRVSVPRESLALGTLVELGSPIVEILEPGRPPRRFIPVQGGLLTPEDLPEIIILE